MGYTPEQIQAVKTYLEENLDTTLAGKTPIEIHLEMETINQPGKLTRTDLLEVTAMNGLVDVLQENTIPENQPIQDLRGLCRAALNILTAEEAELDLEENQTHITLFGTLKSANILTQTHDDNLTAARQNKRSMYQVLGLQRGQAKHQLIESLVFNIQNP